MIPPKNKADLLLGDRWLLGQAAMWNAIAACMALEAAQTPKDTRECIAALTFRVSMLEIANATRLPFL